MIVDRYSNWPIVERADNGSKGLITCLKAAFVTFGIAEELTSDGGPEFRSAEFQRFLAQWGVHHRVSSVAFPHSICRAEIGVKTTKRLLMDNIAADGSLNNDAFQRAILQYRNTPDRDTRVSPAQCLFGQPIRDYIPILAGRYEPHNMWQDTLVRREDALRDRHIKCAERLSEHTKRLPPLVVGDKVRIQNQTGPHPLKWDRTGVIIEVRQFDQYAIRIDGSRRITLRNRKFLRKYIPAIDLIVNYRSPPPPLPSPPNLVRPQSPTMNSPPPSDPTSPTTPQKGHTEPVHLVPTRSPAPTNPIPADNTPSMVIRTPTVPETQPTTHRHATTGTTPARNSPTRPARIFFPTNDFNTPRRSGRITRLPKHFQDYVLDPI